MVPGELTMDELAKYKERCKLIVPEAEAFTVAEMSKVIRKLEEALEERIGIFDPGVPQGDPSDVLREGWSLYARYCSWEDLPPRMEEVVRKAAKILSTHKLVPVEEKK